MSIRDTRRKAHKLWCAVHNNPANPNIIICEFELEEDPEYPLVPIHNDTPEPAEDILNSQPTEEEFKESTEAQNKPLRILRSARKRRGEAAAMEVFNIMSQVQEQLAQAPNLEQFLKVLVGVSQILPRHNRDVHQSDDEDCPIYGGFGPFDPPTMSLAAEPEFSAHSCLTDLEYITDCMPRLLKSLQDSTA